jgi:zinc D-Ala-D-Ala carboxypeptidase
MRLIFVIPKRFSHLIIVISTALLVVAVGAGFERKGVLVNSLNQQTPYPISSSFPVKNHQVVDSQEISQRLKTKSLIPPVVTPIVSPTVAPLSVTPPIKLVGSQPVDLQKASIPSIIIPKIIGSSRIQVPTKYGHFPYAEEAQENLIEAGIFVRDSYSRPEQLSSEAAQAFYRMRDAASLEGILMMPISGFRSISDQRDLFARQIERKGSEAEAARYSAPPGHSEHHTGYAVDIADERYPSTDLKVSFDETELYRWMSINAIRFGFEQSFTLNDTQGVSYEPWHWRFIGSQQSQVVFSASRGQLHGSPLVVDIE